MPLFDLPKSEDFGGLADRISASLALEPELHDAQGEPDCPLERTFYDTFDGRLYSADKLLMGDRRAEQTTLVLEDRRHCARRRVRLQVDGPPRFVWDLPPSRLRAELEPWVEMRALLSQAQLLSEVRPLVQRDENGKTVARVAIERHRLVDGSDSSPLCARVRVEPLKGYAKASRRVVRALKQLLALTPVTDDLLSLALAATGRSLDAYSSKIEVVLEPELRADAAVKRILAEQNHTMHANLEGMCAELDSEFLHDFRVAIRRSRTALTRIRGVFPSRSVARYRRELRWLGQLTGPARDYDVYLLDFDSLTSELPQDLGDHLGPLERLLAERRAAAYDALRAGLQSRRGRRLVADWDKFIAAPLPKHSTLPNAGVPIAEVARRETWRAYRRVLRRGNALTEQSPAADFHELRKRCKALRYLLEFFRSLFPAAETAQLIGRLKALQKILGSFQDLEVQSQAAARWGVELAEQPDVEPETTLALGALTGQLASNQEQTRQRFDAAYRRFASKRNRKLARALFREGKPRNRP